VAAVRSVSSSPKLLPDGMLGMLVFIFTEIMLFAGLVSAHTIVKSGAMAGQMWPPYGQPRLPASETIFNTVILLLSGVLLWGAQIAFRRYRGVGLVPKLTLAGAGLLGTFFVVAQGREWTALVAEGLTLTSSTYGAFFYLIVGVHGLHALAAIGGVAWACHRLWKGGLSREQLGTVAIFWYFVVLVWPILYWRVYL